MKNGDIEIKNDNLSNISIYLDKIVDDIRLLLIPKSYDSDSYVLGDPKQITIKANQEKIIVKIPILEIQGNISCLEDTPIPLLSTSGGVINSIHRGKGLGQTLFLEISDLPANSKLVEIIQSSSNDTSISMPLNLDDEGNLLSKLKLPYWKWESIYLLNPQDHFGEFNFNVKASSIADESKEEKSTPETSVKLIIQPVNDDPIVININDLDKADESKETTWNLRNRFFDVDNKNEQLIITANLKVNNKLIALPNWLSLDSNGILTAIPNNNDVGSYTINISANDPYGGKVIQEVLLEVGNTNQSPTFNAKMPDEWTRTEDDEINVYSKKIKLNSSSLIVSIASSNPSARC